MACRYTYQGKTYEAYEFDDVLKALNPAVAALYMPGLKAIKAAGGVPLFSRRSSDKIATLNGNEVANDITPENVVDKARTWYRDNLQGTDVKREGFGVVRFSGKGLRELRLGLKHDTLKAKLLPAVKSIIKDGEYSGREELYKARSDGIVAFHFFSGPVSVDGSVVTAGVTVGEDAFGNLFYNVSHDQSKHWKDRSLRVLPRSSATAPGGLQVDNESSTQKSVARNESNINIEILDFNENSAITNTTTIPALQQAIQATVGASIPNGLGRIVATTSSEVKGTWEPLLGKTGIESQDAAGQAQAFYDPSTKTIFLLADRIAAGTEQAVLVHELMHKHGKAVLGQDGWNKLHGVIESWKDAKAGSQERQVYDSAAERVAATGAELSNEELFPYAVEAAIKLGIKPNAMAEQGTVAKWLAQVRQMLRKVWDKLTNKPELFNAQDMVALAYGIAGRESDAVVWLQQFRAPEVRDAQSRLLAPNGKPSNLTEGQWHQVRSPQFMAWFGDWIRDPKTASKVVDDNGEPMVLYHGTKSSFDSFNLKHFGKTDGGWAGEGFYFAPDPQEASTYATFLANEYDTNSGGNVMPVFLVANTPLEWMIGNQNSSYIKDKRNDLSAGEFKDWVSSQGHDSVHITSKDIGRVKGENQWMVLSPTQIKSAIGNNGDFDGTNPDIRYSFAGTNAATADTHALTTAQKRIARGDDADTVRKETGWFKGVEGKWKFEINDSDASLTMDQLTWGESKDLEQGSSTVVQLGRLLDHPALFAAYPVLNNGVVVRLVPGKKNASFDPGSNTITVGYDQATKQANLSSLLHEIQHGIQSIEGFAVGGSPSEFAFNNNASRAKKDLEVLRDLRRNPTKDLSLVKEELEVLGFDYSQSHLKWLRDVADEKSLSEFAATANTPLEQYRRLAGETESRNVQARQTFTDEERRAQSPESTADVKASDVIVVFNGKEMHSAPVPQNAIRGTNTAVMHAEPTVFRATGLAGIGSQPVSHESVKGTVAAILKRIPNAPHVEVYRTPVEAGISISDPMPKGGTLPDGRIVIFSDANTGTLDVMRTVFHELFHRGLKSYFQSNADYIKFMLDLSAKHSIVRVGALNWRTSLDGQEKWNEFASKGPMTGDRLANYEALAVEESLARLSETLRAGSPLQVRTWTRGIANVLESIARFFKMGELADWIHGLNNTVVDDFVNQMISRSGNQPVHGTTSLLLRSGTATSSRTKISGNTNRYTPEQLKAFRDVGFEVEEPTYQERAKALWKDAGKKLAQGIADQFAPIKDMDKHAYMLLRQSRGASGAFSTLLKGGMLKLTDGAYDFDASRKGGVLDKLIMPLHGEHHDLLRYVSALRAEQLMNESERTRAEGQKLIADAGKLDNQAQSIEKQAKDYLQQAGNFSKQMFGNLGPQKANAAQASALFAQAKELRAKAAKMRQEGNEKKNVSRENLFTRDTIKAIKTLADGDTAFDYTIQNGARKGQTTRKRSDIYKDATETLHQFNKNVLDMAEQSGLIDPESRQTWESEFYVPFYRVANDNEGISGVNVNNSVVRQKAFERLKGGTNKLNNDLLDNVLQNWAHLIDAAAKNRAAKATLEAAENVGAAISSDQNTLKQIASNVGTSKSNVVWLMDGGEKRYYLVDDPYVMTAISSLTYAGLKSPVMNAMSAFKHALTVGVTLSPFFKVRNLLRDTFQAIAAGNLSYNPAKNLKDGWQKTDPKNDEYFRMLAGGGIIEFGSMYEGSEAKRIQAMVDAGVDPATILDSDEKVKAFYRKFIEPSLTKYNELGNRLESVNRAALYDQRVKEVGHLQASFEARDLMDFSSQGTFTTIRFLTQVVPFMNARIQGLYKLGNAAKEDPARFSAVLGAAALISIALLAAYGDDDDWKRRTDADRNNFWWLKFGDTAVRIPKPFEIGAIATLAERSFERVFSDEMTNDRFVHNIMTLLGDNLSMNPLPQIVKPMLDVYANIDGYSGAPIESMGMDRLKSEYRFKNDTSMTARALSTASNTVMGTIGKDGLSPVQIDHLLRGYFGWLGTTVVAAADVLARPATDQPKQAASDMLKTLTGNMVSDMRDAPSRYVSQLYRQAEAIEHAYNTWRQLQKEGKTVEAKEFFEDNKEHIKQYRLVENVKKAETALNNRLRMIERNTTMEPDRKRELIRQINQQKERIAKRAEGVVG